MQIEVGKSLISEKAHNKQPHVTLSIDIYLQPSSGSQLTDSEMGMLGPRHRYFEKCPRIL